jgi:hypothetical protein
MSRDEDNVKPVLVGVTPDEVGAIMECCDVYAEKYGRSVDNPVFLVTRFLSKVVLAAQSQVPNVDEEIDAQTAEAMRFFLGLDDDTPLS